MPNHAATVVDPVVVPTVPGDKVRLDLQLLGEEAPHVFVDATPPVSGFYEPGDVLTTSGDDYQIVLMVKSQNGQTFSTIAEVR